MLGCESAEEKAERQRLEDLYQIGDAEIAASAHRGYSPAFNAVKAECEKERLAKNQGKWCLKFTNVQKLFVEQSPFNRLER